MILTADPGKRTGIARYVAGALATSTIDGDDIDTVVAVLSAFRTDAKGRGVVVVEDQFAAQHTDKRGRRVINVKTVIKLVERRTTVVAVARALGLPVELVLPATWQGPCFKSVPRFDDHGGELDTKTRAGLFVQQRVNVVSRGSVPGAGGKPAVVPAAKLPKDEKDAAALALYWATWRAGGR